MDERIPLLKDKLEIIPNLEEEIFNLEEENESLKDNFNDGTFKNDMLLALENENKKLKKK